MLIIFIPWTINFLISFTTIVKSLKEGNTSYKWPQYSDLLISISVSLALFIILSIYQKFFASKIGQLISKKYKGKEREFKAEKLVNCVFKEVYYLFSASFGYYLAKDSNYLSPNLGGKGSSLNLFKDYPYPSFKNYETMKLFIIVQLGYHTFSLILHSVRKPAKDYIDMLVHHLMAVLLIGLGYFMNYIQISIAVLLVHDVSDVFGYIGRIFIDTDYKKLTVFGYLGAIVSWFYMRLFVFPFDIIYSGFYLDPTVLELSGIKLLAFMLHCLVIMHAYWYYLYVRIGFGFLRNREFSNNYHVE